VHEVYAVDVLISTGDGKTKEKETRTTVYKRTTESYNLKMKTSRGTKIQSFISLFCILKMWWCYQILNQSKFQALSNL